MDEPMSAAEAASCLLWLAEMGADEIVSETPVARLVPVERVRVAPPVSGLTGAALAASCETLDDIAAALAVMENCALRKTATRLCLYDGHPKARVMVVGEAPGREEDIEGKPFVGRSGQLLDRMLAAIGLSRHSTERDTSVFITNTVFWRPPGNRTPTESETLMCLPFAARLIEIVEPEFIVCLGAIPAQRLTGRSDGILKLRGKWQNYSVNGRNCRLLPTLHPAYLLRQPNQKRLAWRDLVFLQNALNKDGPKAYIG